MKNDKIKEEKGITLTSIIVTVIVLLIIVGVSINLASGSNSLIAKAQTAALAYKEQEIKEKVELKLAELQIINYNGSLYEKLVEFAKNDPEITQVLKNGQNVLLVINDEFVCEIDTSYKIVGDIHVYNKDDSSTLTKKYVNLDYCDLNREVN